MMMAAEGERKGPEGVREELPSMRNWLDTEIYKDGSNTSGTDHSYPQGATGHT